MCQKYPSGKVEEVPVTSVNKPPTKSLSQALTKVRVNEAGKMAFLLPALLLPVSQTEQPLS